MPVREAAAWDRHQRQHGGLLLGNGGEITISTS
jgi:hypothetical protein